MRLDGSHFGRFRNSGQFCSSEADNSCRKDKITDSNAITFTASK